MPLKTQHDEAPSLNLTPMIDIVFLLIIFFMVGTKFTEMERKFQLKVPEVGNVEALSAAPERRVVSVYRDGSITLDREIVTADQLQQRLEEARSEYQDLGVLVRGDGGVDYQAVATALDACRQAGINELGISVRLAMKD